MRSASAPPVTVRHSAMLCPHDRADALLAGASLNKVHSDGLKDLRPQKAADSQHLALP